ncbi:Uncharacterized protein APZ42_023990 [Daphnia magna]|uniref:Uncharacterized protein n=1 Tax=Daphnia magna TaxID=35525 RepID=A0A164UBF6_9CRUS|nr:Uncharacterized protein APZ42_023990 [Daphnia magna]
MLEAGGHRGMNWSHFGRLSICVRVFNCFLICPSDIVTGISWAIAGSKETKEPTLPSIQYRRPFAGLAGCLLMP